MRLLLIETSTERGLIAYLKDCHLLFLKEFPFGLNQSQYLVPDLSEALSNFVFLKELDVIGVGVGPGSYTGIRLGVSVAQALAYSWKLPIVGVPTLNGFIPQKEGVSFAAVLDARIGGIYFRKGWKDKEGHVFYEGDCRVLPLEEAVKQLEGVTHLVTPSAGQLQKKLKNYSIYSQWTWEERSPLAEALAKSVEELYESKKIYPPAPLELLYLRQDSYTQHMTKF